MALKRIRIELARTPEFPEGSSHHGYEFIAPLTPDGHLDTEEWHISKDFCTVKRFWGDEEEEHGHLRHVGRGWRFDYAPETDEDDEPLFRLDRHEIREGDYLSVIERDGEALPFRIVSIHSMP